MLQRPWIGDEAPSYPSAMRQTTAFMLRESEVAARLRVSVATLRRLRQRGTGPEWVRIGKQVRYSVSQWVGKHVELPATYALSSNVRKQSGSNRPPGGPRPREDRRGMLSAAGRGLDRQRRACGVGPEESAHPGSGRESDAPPGRSVADGRRPSTRSCPPPRPTPPQNVVYALSRLRSKRVAAKPAPRDALASASTSRESEVAARLRVSVATLRRLRQRGPGPEWVRIGKQIRYPVSGCEKWLAANLGRVLPKHWRAVGGG
jgi:predicted DNA-binding transcriptional regulator AlpA